MKSIMITWLILCIGYVCFGQTFSSENFEGNLQQIDQFLFNNEFVEEAQKKVDSLSTLKAQFSENQFQQFQIRNAICIAHSDELDTALTLLQSIDQYFVKENDTLNYHFGRLMNGLSQVALNLSKLDLAQKHGLRAINVFKAMKDEENKEYQAAHYNTAVGYAYAGKFQEAEPYFNKNAELVNTIFGSKSEEYVTALTAVGRVKRVTGDYDSAVKIYLEAIEISKQINNGYNDIYPIILGNLANIYHNQGKMEEIEPLYKKAVEIKKVVHGTQSKSYIIGIFNLGGYYYSIGDYEKSLPLILEVIKFEEDNGLDNKIDHAYSLKSVGLVYMSFKEYEKSEMYLNKSLALVKSLVGEKHPTYVNHLGALATLYLEIEKNEKALEFYKLAYDLGKETFGDQHPKQIHHAQKLTYAYEELDDYNSAKKYAIERKELAQFLYGTNSTSYLGALTALIRITRTQENYSEALSYVNQMMELKKSVIARSSNFMSEQELIKYINRNIQGFDSAKALGFEIESPELRKSLYNLALFEKGNLLNSSIAIKEFIFSQQDQKVFEDYTALIENEKMLVKALEKPVENQIGVDSLKAWIETTEKSLARASTHYRNELNQKSIDANQIKDQLAEDEIVIEFTQQKTKTENRYAALTMDSSGEVQYVSLFLESELNLANTSNKRSDYVNELYGFQNRGAIIVERSQNLYQLVWEKLTPYLKDKKTIYYSPSGVLNSINLNAIPISLREVMNDKYEMVNLSSTKNIINDPTEFVLKTAQVFGAVNYEQKEKNQLENSNKYIANSRARTESFLLDRSNANGSWDYLNFTEDECGEINSYLKSNRFKYTYHNSDNATEAVFKSLGLMQESPEIIHLATHGFFFPDPIKSNESVDSQLIFKVSDDPMLRSGLILAGANAAWKGESQSDEFGEDGILTAFEISQMNLNNTKLVVLSACETGLGEINGTEGVYGLQRAFKKAGVKNLIMSLWQIPDRETSVFMGRFYELLLEEKLPINQAFQKTQLEMKERFFDPYQWAGFILVE